MFRRAVTAPVLGLGAGRTVMRFWQIAKVCRGAPFTSFSGGADASMNTGVVKFWNQLRGFGFIARGDGEPDVFVHVTSLSSSGTVLARGQRVLFDVGTDSRTGKERAQNVRPL